MIQPDRLMELMIERIWRIILGSTDRLLIANAPDSDLLVMRLCAKWLEAQTTRMLIIRHDALAQTPATVWWQQNSVAGRVQFLTYEAARLQLGTAMLKEVGLVILVEDELQLMTEIERLMERMRTSSMGDIPVICVSHLPNPPSRRRIAPWFNHHIDGRAISAAPPSQEPEPAAPPTPSQHPYYRNFTAASAAARRVLLGQKKTVETYEAARGKDPKLPPNPASVYPDFERKGGWTMFLTGHRAEVDQ